MEICSVNQLDGSDPSNEGVVSDHLVGTSNGVMLRRIVYINPEDGVTYTYLINDNTLPAYQIVLLYKHRWDTRENLPPVQKQDGRAQIMGKFAGGQTESRDFRYSDFRVPCPQPVTVFRAIPRPKRMPARRTRGEETTRPIQSGIRRIHGGRHHPGCWKLYQHRAPQSHPADPAFHPVGPCLDLQTGSLGRFPRPIKGSLGRNFSVVFHTDRRFDAGTVLKSKLCLLIFHGSGRFSP